VLNVSKETLDAWQESSKFSELSEFFDVALYFNDGNTMEEIVSVCKNLFAGSNDEERSLNLETKLDDYKTKAAENKEKINELENVAKKGSKEELENVIKSEYSYEGYHRPDLLLSISEKYIANYKASNENETELLLKAWEIVVASTAKLKSIDEAKKVFDTFKEKENGFKSDAPAYAKTVKEINLTLKGLQNDYTNYLKVLKNNDPMIGVLENNATIYKENYQYTEEAYTRRQLLDLFKLDQDKRSLQLFLLSMSYYSLGYFDNVRKTAAQLKEQYPSSTYNESLSSIINYMPH